MSVKVVRLSKAANYLGITSQTLRNWTKAGLVACIRMPGSEKKPGERRYTFEEIKRVKVQLEDGLLFPPDYQG